LRRVWTRQSNVPSGFEAYSIRPLANTMPPTGSGCSGVDVAVGFEPEPDSAVFRQSEELVRVRADEHTVVLDER
jgi:hypothetical protein